MCALSYRQVIQIKIVSDNNSLSQTGLLSKLFQTVEGKVKKLLLSLLGLHYIQLRKIHTLKWHILERLILNPMIFLQFCQLLHLCFDTIFLVICICIMARQSFSILYLTIHNYFLSFSLKSYTYTNIYIYIYVHTHILC